MADDAPTPDAELMEPTAVTGAERWALVAGSIAVLVLAGLVGCLGFRALAAHRAEAQRTLFLHVAQQGAVDLSTVDYRHAEADAQRILNLATGTFYDNFSRRSRAFVDSVKQARKKSVGTVTEVGLESEHGDEGQVLVAVTVKSADGNASEQEPQQSRMRITVRKINDAGKVSNVAFVS